MIIPNYGKIKHVPTCYMLLLHLRSVPNRVHTHDGVVFRHLRLRRLGVHSASGIVGRKLMVKPAHPIFTQHDTLIHCGLLSHSIHPTKTAILTSHSPGFDLLYLRVFWGSYAQVLILRYISQFSHVLSSIMSSNIQILAPAIIPIMGISQYTQQ